ncbi:MAG: sigma-70 family RNA polymerase sigma factor [Kiritimatiellae bacterium]|nr:sigma-70 family RNA polymerase sigma factor [Kiritimatiellia bacterium]
MDTIERQLLSQYVREGSEGAFRQIVERFGPLVYSAARRRLRDHQLAEDAAQMTFAILARKAAGLGRKPSLAGWLWRTAMNVAGDITRERAARARRERRWDAEQPVVPDAPWERIAPELDAALAALSARARDALIARYFLGKSHRAIGEELGIREDAARMRVRNGVEKLRAALSGRGLAVSSALLATFLSSRTAEAVPPGLCDLIHTAALGAAAGAGGFAHGLGAGLEWRLRALWASKPAWAAAGGLLAAGALGIGAALIHGRGAMPPGWHVPACERRIRMDWAPADGQVPDETFEWGVELDKLGKASGLDAAVSPERVAIVAEDEAGVGRLLSFDFQTRLEPFSRTRTVFRFQPPYPSSRLWFYFAGEPPARAPFAGRWNLLDGALRQSEFGQWQRSHAALPARILAEAPGPALEFDVDEQARTGLGKADKLELARRFPVAEADRGAPASVAIDVQLVEAFGYVPFRVKLEQYDRRGERIPADVVDPRWLSMNLAVGQDVKLRETGRIHPRAETIEVRIAMKYEPHAAAGWDELRTTAEPVPPDERMRLQIRRLELRTGRRVPLPGRNPELYLAGVSGRPDDRCLMLGSTAQLIFDAHPPGVWGAGLDVTEPAAFHWPAGAGTFECWFKPSEPAADAARQTVVQAVAGDPANAGAEETVFQIDHHGGADGGTFKVLFRDGAKHAFRQGGRASLRPGQWHHLAFCWDPALGRRDLFLDGQSVSKADGPSFTALDLSDDARRSEQVPAAVWVGSGIRSRNPFHACIDELRISDGMRYAAPFAARPAAFAVDAHTRALWHFDGSNEGVHHGDDRVVTAALLSETSPRRRTVEVERRADAAVERQSVEWFPARLPESLNPELVLPLQSYDPLDAGELAAAYTPKRLTLRLADGQTATVSCGAEPVMDYVEIAVADGEQELVAPWLGRDDEVDSRSLERIARTLRLADLPDERSRAIRLFAYLVAKTDYFSMGMYDWTPTRGVRHMYHDPHKLLNNYLQFICGALNRTAMHSFLAAGLSANEFPGSGHCFQQVYYDNAWHLYDLSFRRFFPARDNTRAASVAEVQDDPAILHHYNPGYWLPAGKRGARFMNRELLFHDATYALRPGESFRYSWWNAGRVHDAKTYEGGVATELTDRFQPHISNGVLTLDCRPSREHPALTDWTDAGFGYTVKTPYVLADAELTVAAAFARPAAAVGIELSNDGGRTWQAVATLSGSPGRRVFNLKKWVVGRYTYALRFRLDGASIERLAHRAFVQMNPRVLTPCLETGANRLTFSCRSGAATVTLGYREVAGALECAGGVGFGFIRGRERYLLACRPGESRRLTVAACMPSVQLRVPAGIESRLSASTASAGPYTFELQPESALADGLYSLTLAAGEREKRLDLLVARHVGLWTGEALAGPAGAALIGDPDVAGRRVLRLGAEGARAVALPGAEFAGGDYLVWVLLKRPRGQRNAAPYLQVADRRYPFRRSVHRYYEQQMMDGWWGWRALEPESKAGAVSIVPGAPVRLGCKGGEVHVAAVCLVPAADPRLARLGRLYFENYNFDPVPFE